MFILSLQDPSKIMNLLCMYRYECFISVVQSLDVKVDFTIVIVRIPK